MSSRGMSRGGQNCRENMSLIPVALRRASQNVTTEESGWGGERRDGEERRGEERRGEERRGEERRGEERRGEERRGEEVEQEDKVGEREEERGKEEGERKWRGEEKGKREQEVERDGKGKKYDAHHTRQQEPIVAANTIEQTIHNYTILFAN